MYIINTSFMVESPVHDRWYHFFTTKVVDLVRASGFGGAGASAHGASHNSADTFDNLVFTRVLHDVSEGHYTYSLQVPVADMVEYQRFMDVVMSEYSSVASGLFAEQALHFTTVLKRIAI